jgi:3-oxoacyl-[acyl-carrier-protein] synthase II
VRVWPIKSVFGDFAYEIPIRSTKSIVGLMLGAAGAVKAFVCALSIDEGKIHPTINYDTPDPDCDLDCVPNKAWEADILFPLSNSFGLGGQNPCLVLGRVDERG